MRQGTILCALVLLSIFSAPVLCNLWDSIEGLGHGDRGGRGDDFRRGGRGGGRAGRGGGRGGDGADEDWGDEVDEGLEISGEGGGGRGGSRGGSRGGGSGGVSEEDLGDEVEGVEVSDYGGGGGGGGGGGRGGEVSVGYTIKKLYAEENDPPLGRYPRVTDGAVDTESMWRYDGVPRSTQRIRLRGNRSDMNPNEGRIEIEHRGSWGLACDGHFGMTEASVACRSLGFKKGANKAYSNSFFGTGKFQRKDIQMAQVRCSAYGRETDLHQCSHSHSSNCLLGNTAGVECTYNEGCEWGWTGYDGLCYRVEPSPKTAEAAASECISSGANLAYVLSDGENNFISNLMYTKFKNVSAIWTGGQFARVEKKRRTVQAWVFKNTDHAIQQDKSFWFPGFADGSSPRPTVDGEKKSCLALSKIFYRREDEKDVEVDYFWWDNVSCKTKLPYICQKLAVASGCYNGTGQGYRGDATRTEDGSLCQSWGDENPDWLSSGLGGRRGGRRRGSSGRSGRHGRSGRRSRGRSALGSGGYGRSALGSGGYGRSALGSAGYGRSVLGRSSVLEDHNYCRNPDGDKKPWCWIDKKQGIIGYCNIKRCSSNNSTINSSKLVGPPKGLNASFNSPMCDRPDQFFCPSMINYRPKCVGKRDVCDSYKDCVGGEDEDPAFCKAYKCKSEEFYCKKVHRCIPVSRVCDRHYDCDYGDDESEEACRKYKPDDNSAEEQVLLHYAKTDSIDETSVPYPMHTITYYTLSLSQCQSKCDSPGRFVCAGFLFSTQSEFGKQCVLLSGALPAATVVEGSESAYYEKMQTCQSSTQFVCKNNRCIAGNLQCNGYDDCGDFSDEIGPSGCPDPRSSFEVRLSGGKGPHEGRVEVKLFNEWGLVCDDGLDLKLGNLVCRQLGYPQGVEKLSHNARREFGRGSGEFLMGSVNCTGTNSSLYDCRHRGWKNTKCNINNVAGLVCRKQRPCTNKELRCADTCVPFSAVCDGKRDCPDGADERTCSSMTLTLQSGNASSNGVLEVMRGGIPGAVCDDAFGEKEVRVACRQLGFANPGRKLPPGTYPAPQNLVMWVQAIKCSGTEANLFACNISNWGKTNCDVNEAVNIECGLPQTPPSTTKAPVITTPPAADVTTGLPSTVACGQRFGRFPAGRIINGFPATTGQFPWQVGIRLRLSKTEHQQWCGGTIVSDRWIVTAAHCFEEHPKSSFILRIGDVDNTVKETSEREFDIDLLISHQKYTGSPAIDFDFALIKIKPDRQGFITFNEAVQPACLPEKTLVAPKGTVCHVSGWGSVGDFDLPKNLMAANVPLIEKVKCNEMYAGRITDRMQCAGFEAGGVDSCQGDSGGPLVCKIEDRYVLMGATSWGEGCAIPRAPGVYANVRDQREWIDQTIRSNS